MKTFMNEDFLLSNDISRTLYHGCASRIPIIDYHCHVDPREIAENKRYENITELWLTADHYKWRAVRSAGAPESVVTGEASDYEKFKAYCAAMPSLIGNPLYHWSHLELRRYFDCDLTLNLKNCDEIWALTAEKLKEPEFYTRALIERSNVKLLCTTDDPADTLEYHKIIAEDKTSPAKVLPAFRPDKCFNVNKKGLGEYYEKLGAAAGVKITDLASLKEALVARMDYFASLGCRTADHGLDEYPMYVTPNEYEADKIMKLAVESDGSKITPEQLSLFKTEMITFLAGEYARRGWVMQLHCGVYRNANTAIFRKYGPDMGFDTIGHLEVSDLIKLLDTAERRGDLLRCIVYAINPTDNAAIAAMIGSFQTAGDGMPKVMQGSAWWFSDTIDGMRAQMKQLANLSAFGKFLGMLTDSRSFTSYTRHEYFRRILCDVIGEWVNEGLFPCDVDELAQLVMDICYNNAKNFFRFEL